MSLTFAPETIEFFAYTELGKVEQTITPHQRGRVRFMATHWFARFYQPNGQTNALPGTTVRVVGRQGLTLLVVTADEDWTNVSAQPRSPAAAAPGSVATRVETPYPQPSRAVLWYCLPHRLRYRRRSMCADRTASKASPSRGPQARS